MINADYGTLIAKLLPAGPAWNKEPNSNLMKLLSGLGEELKRVDDVADGVVTEANPLTMAQMLQVRRDEAGLPDPCRGEPATFQEKVAEVVSKWGSRGGQSINYLTEVCRLYGYDVYIQNGVVGTHTFTVNYITENFIQFRAGKSTCGEHLQLTVGTSVHCVIEKFKPAHTHAIYNPLAPEAKFW
jgi:uncharacterized protein YmfQ (DUF2313 family)